MIFDRLRGGRRTDPPPDIAAALAELTTLAENRPELATAANSLRAVISAAFLVGDDRAVMDRQADAYSAATVEDAPIFRALPPSFDEKALRQRALAIARLLGDAGSPAAEAIRRGLLDVPSWARLALDGRGDVLDESAESNGISPEFARSLTRMVLLPSLARLTRRDDLGPSTGCPWCGEGPILAELRGLEREVRLRCGLCAGDWPGGRLLCPACGETDHRRLETFHVEGEEDRCRLQVCRGCGLRIKLVATFARLSPSAMVVADLATIHLDLVGIPDE